MAARRDRNGHGLVAVRVTGALLPPDFLQTIARLEATKQSGADYGLSKSLVLKDEIARYWRIANDLYAAYVERRQRTDLDAQVTGVDEWLVPLFRDVLGYTDISRCDAIAIDGQVYPITDLTLDRTVPLLFTTRDVSLDRADARFGDEGRRRTPYGVVQEILNSDDDKVWGFVSNGTTLRLLHDNPSLTRPAYVEADLERIFEEQIYADFSALWLTLHASRLRAVDRKPSTCILEAWREQAHEIGERALEHLRDGVTTALRELGNGFLRHPQNEALRASLANGTLTSDSYFQELLRLVYRLLFLFAAEDRHLLYSPTATDEQRTIYRDGYSLSRLRDRALRRRYYDRHSDLWQSLKIVFSVLAGGGIPLGLPALGGLFSADQCTALDAAAISNNDLLEAVRALAFFRTSGILARVNYRDMGTEELGSVYESLLELHPLVKLDASPWTFDLIGAASNESSRGSTRRLTGSYYTPAPLVDELVKSALGPLISTAAKRSPEDPRSALLDIKIIDPACGSGHFLLAAARRLANEIARIEAGADSPDESARQHALREVVQHCVHGVDRNPLAVELCKAALWIEALEPGKPLTFLESHILCGDSLVGVLDPTILNSGIPDEAYKALSDDDDSVCRSLKRRNRNSEGTVQGNLFDQEGLKSIESLTYSLDTMPEETLEDVERKRQAWIVGRDEAWRQREELRANLAVAAFFAPKTRETSELVPVTEDLNRVDRGMPMRMGVERFVADLAEQHHFFHWHIAFPDVMRRGGFDVILGNPPWDVSELDEEEYFAVKAPSISRLPGAARKRAIAQLQQDNPRLWQQYRADLRTIEGANVFARGSSRFPLTARGKLNTYALFAETFLGLMATRGYAGIVVPTGIATDSSTKAFFGEITISGKLVSLLSFENEEFVFPDVHNAFKFCLLTLRGAGAPETPAEYVFFARQAPALRDPDRRIFLTSADIALMNPNTRTALIFRSRADADLTKKIYARVPVLLKDQGQEGSRWNIMFRQGLFNMASDSTLFRTAGDLETMGARRSGSKWTDSDHNGWLPLYEGKLIDLYDHRASSYEQRGAARGVSRLPRTSDEQHADALFEPAPYYWVRSEEVAERVPAQWKRQWFVGFRDVTSAVNERTFICSFFPYSGVGHTLPLLFQDESPHLQACLLANLSSLVFDYVARQKLGGFHMSFFYVAQLPVLPPATYSEADYAFIVPRVLELSYTSESLRCLAEDLGFSGSPYVWDAERRGVLRAELDAYYARLYQLSRDELRFIIDPADALGPTYPSETFRVLKEREIAEYGEYRTARLTLAALDALEGGDGNGKRNRPGAFAGQRV